MNVYFAHLYPSWERGLNENTNGLLRQYLPKNKSFADLTQKDLAKIVEKLNNRPRKSFGYRTPLEAFLIFLSHFKLNSGLLVKIKTKAEEVKKS